MSQKLRAEVIKKLMDKQTKSIAIVTHNKPDGDAIGSAVALEESLKKAGKKVVDLILQDKVNRIFAPIIGEHRVNKIIMPPEGRKYDVIIMVDCSDPERTYEGLRRISKFIIVLDHHTNKEPFGDIYVCEKVAATAVLIYKIIQRITPITPSIATALYLGIRSDTGSFRNANTDSKSLELAGKLLVYGANIELINTIYENKSLEFVKLMGLTLSDVKVNKKYKISYLIVTRDKVKQSGASDEEVSFLIDQFRGIQDIDICFLFTEGISNVRISARSKSSPVNKILEYFGGGGHSKAAGCAIEGICVFEAAEQIITYTKNCIDNNTL